MKATVRPNNAPKIDIKPTTMIQVSIDSIPMQFFTAWAPKRKVPTQIVSMVLLCHFISVKNMLLILFCQGGQ